jgi:hypothetical protein
MQIEADEAVSHTNRNSRIQIENDSNDGEQGPDPRISSWGARRLAYGLMHQCLCLN